MLLADDHAILREGLRLCLQGQEGIDVVGEAEDGAQAVRLAGQVGPDVVVLDVAMPRLNGMEAVRLIKRDQPHVKVVMLSMHDNESYVVQALQAGASGYVLKRTGAAELARAIRAAFDGHVYLSPGIAARVVADYVHRLGRAASPSAPHERLTPREREVLQLAAEGLTTRAIAERLVLAPRTAEHHRESAMAKLNLHNQTELVKYAVRTGLATVDG